MQSYSVGSMFWAMVVPGMLVVFVVLVLLIGCIYLMTYVTGKLPGGNKTPPPPPPKKVVPVPAAKAAPAPVPSTPAPTPSPPVQSSTGVSGEVVAAISAAVACVMETPYAITSVTPAASLAAYPAQPLQPVAAALPERRRPVWGFAGMQQNTRPF